MLREFIPTSTVLDDRLAAATVEHTKSNPPSRGTRGGRQRMLVLLPPGSRWLKSWKAPTFVPFGDKNRQGSADADPRSRRSIWQAGIRSSPTSPTIAPFPRPPSPTQGIDTERSPGTLVGPGRRPRRQAARHRHAGRRSADIRWLIPSRSTESAAVRRTVSSVDSPSGSRARVDALTSTRRSVTSPSPTRRSRQAQTVSPPPVR